MDGNLAERAPLQPLARYQAEGQVARTGFRDPKWVPLHFTVIQGGALGVTWLTLSTFSMFMRLEVPGRDSPLLEELAANP